MTNYNAMRLDELYGELETRWFESIHDANEMEREDQRRSAVVTALCHLAADLDAEGLVVVPREPTPAMVQSLVSWAHCHGYVETALTRAIAAAPLPEGV